jgi:hypothetical protein
VWEGILIAGAFSIRRLEGSSLELGSYVVWMVTGVAGGQRKSGAAQS